MQSHKDKQQRVHSVAEPDTNGMVSAHRVAPSPKRSVPLSSSMKSSASSSSLAHVQVGLDPLLLIGTHARTHVCCQL